MRPASTRVKRVTEAVAPSLSEASSASLNVDARPPAFSDDALALRFAERHAEDRLYVARWSKWLVWDGKRWCSDDTLRAFDDARAICREAAAQCNDAKVAKALASAATVAAIERLARADRRLAATASQFDADPWLLNTPDGVVDLRTGEIRDPRREDFMTKMASASPGGSCERWVSFLNTITGSDLWLRRYLARVAGYALTGSIREHVFFFAFGHGANGKSVFAETISALMGDYAMAAPVEMFVASKLQGHTTDIAGLQGARFVTASETEAGRALAEAKIKLLTGGDTVSARRMRADNVAFSPQFKLFITGNHKPRLNSNDEAMRRRLHLIPFEVTIPVHARDQKLPEKLREEWPGILRWAIDGCIKWQSLGLAPPPAVREATDEYLDAEDTVQAWLSSAVELDPNARSSTEQLFASWRQFAEQNREEIGGIKDFTKALEAKQFVRKHGREGNRWHGIRLLGKAQ